MSLWTGSPVVVAEESLTDDRLENLRLVLLPGAQSGSREPGADD